MPLREFFYTLADTLTASLHSGEVLTLYFEAEDSDFIRFNRNQVRQAGSVQQLELSLDLIAGYRHVTGSCHLVGDLKHDLPPVQSLLSVLREQRPFIPEDPYLFYATGGYNTETMEENDLPLMEVVLKDIVTAAAGLDLVGLWAGGRLYRGFANSLGQRNWYSTSNFNFDWSCYHRSDRAVKSQYAETGWDPTHLEHKMQEVREQLDLLHRPAKVLTPGRYRVYLAPTALMEIFSLLGWSGFGLKNHRTQQTPLLKMAQGKRLLHPLVNLSEYPGGGVVPCFTEAGFQKPERVRLITQGAYQDCLVSPRSSKEYGIPVNAGSEIPQSLDLAPGRLRMDEVCENLERGIYINNLWYSNFSDPNEARITGMTRYACFWVEGGQPQAPIDVMRFDESWYQMFGENLLDLTTEREFLLDSNTYERRSLSSFRLPGALVDQFTLTL